MAAEIEIRFRPNKDQKVALNQWLEKNAIQQEPESHLEYYINNPENTFKFDSPHGNYIDAEVYFRVRFREKDASVTIKKFDVSESGMGKNQDEFETIVEDGEEFLRIMETAGFTDQTKVKKSRQKFLTKEFEIVIDEVEGLGMFVEIELLDSSKALREGLDQIKNFIKNELGFKTINQQNRGYVSMLWNPDFNFEERFTL